MKKTGIPKSLLMIFIIICMTAIAFAGCQGKKQQNSPKQANASQRQAAIKDGVQALVSDGTINQDQADKILEALTANAGGFQGRRNGQNSQPGSQQNGQQNNQQNGWRSGGQNGGQSQGQGQRPNGQRYNVLEKLVSDGTITQAQADAVMQKVMGNFRGGQPSGTTKTN